MDWARDGADWPNREHSRFVTARAHRWHLQDTGEGPTVLLLHGAGGATQSWRDLLPRLGGTFHVIAPDLPGQGFSRCGARHRLSLPKMAEDLAALAASEGWRVDLIVGHSAGAVLALELARRLRPRGVVGLNAALGKFDGVAGWLFPLMAKALALNPFAASILTRIPNTEARVRELLATTGSRFDDRTLTLYRRLAADRDHVAGTIAMMAQWNIDSLLAQLETIECPVLLLAGANDGTVPPEISTKAGARLPQAEVALLPGLGHLMHEEAPDLVAERIEAFARALGLMSVPKRSATP
ncbi:alpha/beta fold hydrolase BchO [Palleronia sp. KMU-117]|uniref:alpha/beta fold hydrolase BchO n=1 Tax=Palleronia sp. KMU-117 TaxID=3434108 RepID=UPI003D754A8E